MGLIKRMKEMEGAINVLGKGVLALQAKLGNLGTDVERIGQRTNHALEFTNAVIEDHEARMHPKPKEKPKGKK